MRQITSLLLDIRKEQISKLRPEMQERATNQAVTLFEAMDDFLSSARINREGTMDDPETSLQEVMTTADFTYALKEFVQRRMIPGYQAKRFEFEPLVYIEQLPNYMTVTRYQNRSSLPDLEYVPEKGQARAGDYPDATKRQLTVYDWKKQYDFSMHALKNDDLGYFDEMGRLVGEAARRSLEKFVSRMYNNATSIARLVGLGALYSTTGRLTSSRVSTARQAFGQRLDNRGNPITVDLRYIVGPVSLSDTAMQILRSQLVPELATNGVNVVAGSFQYIPDPYVVATAPTLPWWAFCDPNTSGVRPLVLARQTGWPVPALLRKKSDMEYVGSLLGPGTPAPPIMGDFATNNVEVEIWDVWGTYVDPIEGNWFDYRGGYYSSGTAA